MTAVLKRTERLDPLDPVGGADGTRLSKIHSVLNRQGADE